MAPLPLRVAPKLATLCDRAPEGEKWLHEIKHDGYRLMCWIDDGEITLRTRGQHDWTGRFPEIALAAAALPARSVILDGEVCCVQANGASSFSDLQDCLSRKSTGRLVYFAFDVLHLDGYDLRKCRLDERKALLAKLIADGGQNRIQYVDHLDGDGAAFFHECSKLGLEGIVSKRRDKPYRSGRGKDWLKVKCLKRGEFVIGGYTEPDGSRDSIGALLLGQWNDAGELVYVGRVGTGFSRAVIADLLRRLRMIEQEQTLFANVARKRFGRVHWVRPQLVAQVEFSTWTVDGRLRHPSFECLLAPGT